MGSHVCLPKHGWALNCCFAWFFGTAAMLVQGGGVVADMRKMMYTISSKEMVA